MAKIDLGSKPSRLMPTKAPEKKYYPSLHVDLAGENPLANRKIGDEFTATVKMRVVGARESGSGTCLDIECQHMEMPE